MTSVARHGRAVIAAVLCAAVIGCTTTKTVHQSAPKPTPTPTVTPVAVLIYLATNRECAQFSTAYSAMEVHLAGTQTRSDLIEDMSKYGEGWRNAFSAAAKVADRSGVPAGHNQARRLAADLQRDAVDIEKLEGEIALGSSGKFNHAWNHTFTDLAETQSQC
jgi:hypothetical protein